MSDTRKEVFKKIHERCFQLGSCNYKETGCSDCPINMVIVKAENLLDKEEQGLLISVPCKIGDIIYEPTNRNTINEYRVTGIKKEAFAIWIEWKLEKGFVYQSIYGVEVGDFGKTVFLTRSEAESALAKMEVSDGRTEIL